MTALTWTYLITCFIMIITGLILVPVIRTISLRFGYVALPNGRSSHIHPIPNIGGLIFYLVFVFALLLDRITGSQGYSDGELLLSPAILLVLGLMDDRLIVPVKIKALLQVFAIVVFINYSDIRFTTIYGLGELNDQIGFYLTLFFLFTVLNAFNLVDGIDGLASLLAIISLSISSWIFYLYNSYFDSLFLIALTGMLIPFLISNLGKNNKMLMGDTGSMLLGFILGLTALKIYQIDLTFFNTNESYISQAGIFSLIAYPVMDMIRVFFARLFDHSSPFRADRRHFHHILLDHFLLSHLKASMIILSFHISIILSAFLLMPYLSFWGFTGLYLSYFIVFCLGVYLIRIKVPFRAGFPKRKTQPV